MTGDELAAAYQAHLNTNNPGEPWRVRHQGGGWLLCRRRGNSISHRVRSPEALAAITLGPREIDQ